jgi:hypothetical protein
LLADDIDSTNPIAPERASQARLDYLALGDWHGTKRIDDRTWYSGTPEPDRFKANDSGQALLVSLGQPGATPQVQVVTTRQFRWRMINHVLNVASDVEELIAALATVEAHDVLELVVSGQIDLSDHIRLQQALGSAEARLRSLRRNLSGLRLTPTPEDIASLHADGYLGEVIQELRDTAGDDGQRAQDALALLTGLLVERKTGGVPA